VYHFVSRLEASQTCPLFSFIKMMMSMEHCRNDTEMG